MVPRFLAMEYVAIITHKKVREAMIMKRMRSAGETEYPKVR